MEDNLKGHANEGIGKAKSALGDATGDEKLQAEGAAQQGQGAVQKIVGDVKSKLDEAGDAIKKAIDDHK